MSGLFVCKSSIPVPFNLSLLETAATHRHSIRLIELEKSSVRNSKNTRFVS